MRVGVERNRNQETGSFQELLELVISGKCMHSRYPHKTPGIKNSCKITRSCSTPTSELTKQTKIQGREKLVIRLPCQEDFERV